jgi:hypothetical protein
VQRNFALHCVGHLPEIKERFYGISLERKIKHPAIVAILEEAREDLFTAGSPGGLVTELERKNGMAVSLIIGIILVVAAVLYYILSRRKERQTRQPPHHSRQGLARISHKLVTAAADLIALTAFRSVGLLDVLSSTTARASVARPCQDGISTASLHKLMRNAG